MIDHLDQNQKKKWLEPCKKVGQIGPLYILPNFQCIYRS